MPTRQIALDTETTGLSTEHGHRIIEIGCVEMIDRRITKNHFHVYLNPEREVDAGALRVHGLSNQFLSDKPLFHEVAKEFMAFIEGAELIIHNAAFDIGFLRHELTRIQWSTELQEICTVCDTLLLSREKHPGQRHSLDALCKRYEIDNSHRQLHGALLDAEILASVYLAMTGGQWSLFDEETAFLPTIKAETNDKASTVIINETLVVQATMEECERHQAFMASIQDTN
ncbi:MAG: DNA polymerase III subunit epsilon [Legionella sp.]|nr:DNA polymerase III subunit epsilon [Legionella sp.]